MKEHRLVIVGRIGAPFGLQGWLKVTSYTEPAAKILDYQPWQLHHGKQCHEVTIAAIEIHHQHPWVRFMGCSDRNTAQSYVGTEIAVARANFSKLSPDEYYWTDLEGLAVINTSGQYLGTVAYLFDNGANDVVVVEGEEQQHLLPFLLDKIIIDVNLAKGVITVNWDL